MYSTLRPKMAVDLFAGGAYAPVIVAALLLEARGKALRSPAEDVAAQTGMKEVRL